MKENKDGYGAVIERGEVLEATEAGARVRSFSRDGVVSRPLPCVVPGLSVEPGDKVCFYMFPDGTGGIIAAM